MNGKQERLQEFSNISHNCHTSAHNRAFLPENWLGICDYCNKNAFLCKNYKRLHRRCIYIQNICFFSWCWIGSNGIFVHLCLFCHLIRLFSLNLISSFGENNSCIQDIYGRDPIEFRHHHLCSSTWRLSLIHVLTVQSRYVLTNFSHETWFHQQEFLHQTFPQNQRNVQWCSSLCV